MFAWDRLAHVCKHGTYATQSNTQEIVARRMRGKKKTIYRRQVNGQFGSIRLTCRNNPFKRTPHKSTNSIGHRRRHHFHSSTIFLRRFSFSLSSQHLLRVWCSKPVHYLQRTLKKWVTIRFTMSNCCCSCCRWRARVFPHTHRDAHTQRFNVGLLDWTETRVYTVEHKLCS